MAVIKVVCIGVGSFSLLSILTQFFVVVDVLEFDTGVILLLFCFLGFNNWAIDCGDCGILAISERNVDLVVFLGFAAAEEDTKEEDTTDGCSDHA